MTNLETRRKLRPGAVPRHLAHSLYSGELGAHDPGLYRSTRLGAPDVVALVRPGMAICTSYGTGGIVIKVAGPYVHFARNGKQHPHFTIIYVPIDRFGRHGNSDRNCVAIDGRILMLLEANNDEVFIDGFAERSS